MMRVFSLALLLASVSMAPAYAQRDRGDERIQGIDEGRQARAERLAERAVEVQSQRQEAPPQVEMAQRRDGGGGWQVQTDQGPGIRQSQAQPQAFPQPVPQAQARGNWDGNGNGGNRGWREQNRSADVNNAPVMNRDWRGNRDGQGDNNRRWQDRTDRQANSQPTPQAVPPVARNDGRDWNRDRNNQGWNRDDRNRDGRDRDGRDDRNWNGNRDGQHVWNRGDNGRWERHDNDRNHNNGQRWGDNRWNDGHRNDGRWNDGRNWNNNQNWNNQWRNDRRYDWQRHRQSYRNQYRQSRYYNPYGSRYGYQRFGIGVYLDSLFFGNNYWLDDPYQYRLPAAPYGTRWVRYYDDVLLVDVRTGYVIDVINDFFW